MTNLRETLAIESVSTHRSVATGLLFAACGWCVVVMTTTLAPLVVFVGTFALGVTYGASLARLRVAAALEQCESELAKRTEAGEKPRKAKRGGTYTRPSIVIDDTPEDE